MKRAIATVSVVMGLGIVSAPAQAQAQAQDETATGSRLDPSRRSNPNSSTVQSSQTVYRMIRCDVSKRPEKAEAFLGALDPAQAEYEEGVLFKTRECSFGWLVDPNASEIRFSASQSVIRGMVAEILLERSKDDDALQPLEFQLHYPRSWHGLTSRDKAVDEMATCVADIDPQGIRKLLATDFESAEERAALRAVVPELGKCLQAGYKLDGNPLGLRTALAEALYYRAFHPELAAAADQTDTSK